MIKNAFADQALHRLVLVFVISRIVLVVAAFTGHSVLPEGKALTGDNLRIGHEEPVIVDMWARWDSEWYLLIAEHGYDAASFLHRLEPRYKPQDTAGFFPLYPLLIRGVSTLMNPIVAGVIISNLALLASLWLLLDLARRLWGASFGNRAGVIAGCALLIYPGTVFHSAVYAESLYLALSLATLNLARRGRFGWAGLTAGLATLSRPFGALLAIPLLVEWWQVRHRSRWGWLSVLGIVIGLGLFMLYCYGLFGDALAFVHRQDRWRGGLGVPSLAIWRWWAEGPTFHGAHGSTIELLLAVFFLSSLPIAIRRLRPSLSSYLVVGVLLPLSSSLWSFGRIASTLFPIYLLIGLSWEEGRRAVPTAYAVIASIGAIVAAACFAAGWWVG